MAAAVGLTGTETMFQRIHRYATTDSTNERAFASLAEGTARHGDVHVALEQTVGRGRFGRHWESPRGVGLYLSVVLLPPGPIAPAALTIASGLAARDTVLCFGVTATMKWPNDVLIGRRKIAGVLVETRGLAPEAPHYVIGIGLNVGQRSFPEPERGEENAGRPEPSGGRTSLALLGSEASVQDAERALLARLADRLTEAAGSPERLCSDFLDASQLADCHVRLLVGGETVHGEVVGLDLGDGLRIRGQDGTVRTVALEHVRELARA